MDPAIKDGGTDHQQHVLPLKNGEPKQPEHQNKKYWEFPVSKFICVVPHTIEALYKCFKSLFIQQCYSTSPLSST